jgi:hypothetical protein
VRHFAGFFGGQGRARTFLGMVGWILPLAVTIAAQTPPPSEVADPADPTAAVTTAEPAVPAVEEPEPEPEPESEPAVDVGATASAGYDEETAPTATRGSTDAAADDDSPVVRPEEGQWGMQFTFGGLAPMSIAGIDNHGVNRLLFSELGFRRVLRNGWVLPFSIGAGLFHHNPDADGAATQNDVGLSASIGIRKWFRTWRRIAPFAGADFHLRYLDPSGDNNWLVGIGLGPTLGIEYFVGDRVSLLMQGDATLGFNVFDGLLQVSLATAVSFGGQMGLAFYF